MIHLIGPGGAGKSTVGPLVAALLGCRFCDLDRVFEDRHGDIDRFLDQHGYAAYSHANVQVYQDVAINDPGVLALSSGFMTYPDNTHPALPSIRHTIEGRPSTVVLLPSLDLEVCLAETIRRQRTRGLPRPRSDTREEAVIRARFPVYAGLAARQITTMRPAAAVAAEIAGLVMSAECRKDGSGVRALC
jgi:shikimate kinase